MASKPNSIGFIGLSAKVSWAARSHLHYLKATSHYKITALQNSSKSAAETAAATYSLQDVHKHENPTSLANDPSVDIVAVSVNVPEHYKFIKPALEAGKDVFVEWPLAANLTDALELTLLAPSKGVRTMVGLQARQNLTIITAKDMVASGKLGRILGTNMYGHGGIFGPTIGENFLYGLPIEAGANLVTIPFGYAVDALRFVLGEFESLNATLGNQRPELVVVDGEGKEVRKVKKTNYDHVAVTGELVGGAVADVVYINGTEGSLVLEGSSGHVQMFQPTMKFFDGKGNEEKVEVEKTGNWDKRDFSFNVGKAWDAWAGQGLEDGYSVTTFEDAVVRHWMIEAVYKSAEKGVKGNYV
ncbi:NAD-binding Rossmann fold oxidoreductase family protein [Clohesyomyces aquaticus]|uniref:NAD-binding Rossmann fold oxidoreductase family protein n=1 Tax=Clohesyomyces aquaticus TaxID=1231657 RepID=A0A1Y1ZI07_9PLEO|nr:NAD-binding Rossmann fold oxidoreductase family protein [Clohesyomyces aquaticus]